MTLYIYDDPIGKYYRHDWEWYRGSFFKQTGYMDIQPMHADITGHRRGGCIPNRGIKLKVKRTL